MNTDDGEKKGVAIIFAGGGSGGHIFPALAIAEQIRLLDATTNIQFLCSTRTIDHQILSAHNEIFDPLPAQPLRATPRGVWRLARSWGPSVRKTRAALRSLKDRNLSPLLVSLGGFVAAPAAQAARAERCRLVAINLDARLGLASRFIARRAHTLIDASPAAAIDGDLAWQARSVSKTIAVPPIVRDAAAGSRTVAQARQSFGLDENKPTLLITGGSQGARSINDFLSAFVRERKQTLADWQILHQTGAGANISHLRETYEQADLRAIVTEFIDDMPSAWAAADLSIARCGAGTIAEIWASVTPALLLPYPYHSDEHQRLNAQPLASRGGVIIAHDEIAGDKNMETHAKTLQELLTNPGKRGKMAEALRALGPADGGRRIAELLLK